MLSKTILSYEGPLSFSTIDWLLTQFKYAAQDNDINFKVYKKLLSIMIEALENITKYSDQFEHIPEIVSEHKPSFTLNQNGSSIEMVTKNPVKNDDVEALRQRIDRVNNKSRDELKELYKVTITDGQFTPKGGAGLGFIEMAKTSGQNLEYSFVPISGDFSLYTFRVKIDL